jgi:hypothetical protein
VDQVVCVAVGTCADAASASQCPMSGVTPPATAGATAVPGGEKVPVPGSQKADGIDGAGGPGASVVGIIIAVLLCTLGVIVFIVKRRRKQARALSTPRALSTRVTTQSDDGATQLRYYGEAPGPDGDTANDRRPRSRSRSSSRSNARNKNVEPTAPSGPTSYGPAPGSWATGGYGGTKNGTYHNVPDNQYAPVAPPQAAYRSLPTDAPYQSLSVSQQSYESLSMKPSSYESLSVKQRTYASHPAKQKHVTEQYHAPHPETTAPVASSLYANVPKSPEGASPNVVYSNVTTGRNGPGGARGYPAVQSGVTASVPSGNTYASSPVSASSGTSNQAVPSRDSRPPRTHAYDSMYTPN